LQHRIYTHNRIDECDVLPSAKLQHAEEKWAWTKSLDRAVTLRAGRTADSLP
jgi:hypothetical protein